MIMIGSSRGYMLGLAFVCGILPSSYSITSRLSPCSISPIASTASFAFTKSAVSCFIGRRTFAVTSQNRAAVDIIRQSSTTNSPSSLAPFENKGRRCKHHSKDIHSSSTTRLYSSTSSSYLSSLDSKSMLRIDDNNNSAAVWKTDIPLVFVPGMKGTHLAFNDDLDQHQSFERKKKRRVWLTLSGLLNFPPRPDGHLDRSLALPLTYSKDGIQDHGRLKPDGLVDHIVEFGAGDGANTNLVEFFPFYGHVSRHLEQVNARYLRLQTKSSSQPKQEALLDTTQDINNNSPRKQNGEEMNTGNAAATSQHLLQARPTAIFPYDWRRSVPELSNELHQFCCDTFPNQPVQIVAHSMGGLLTYGAMRSNPSKYAPGAVLVGVPFGTGVQYLQDMHKGYYTELERCKQFTPPDQFTFSSHWIFFPFKEDVGDLFVDVSELDEKNVTFVPDTSSIGKTASGDLSDVKFQKGVTGGMPIEIDFYNVDDWEKHQFGIFNPYYRNGVLKEKGGINGRDTGNDNLLEQYRQHMRAQLQNAKDWRETALREYQLPKYRKYEKGKNGFDGKKRKRRIKGTQKINDDLPLPVTLPPLVICATDSIPTVNQILRRKRKIKNDNNSNISNIGRGNSMKNVKQVLKIANDINKDIFSLSKSSKSITGKTVSDNKQNLVEANVCSWEYDYVSGRSVPGDGRIDYDKAFPLGNVPFKEIRLKSPHAKQMCWEANGGSWGTIWDEIMTQIKHYNSTQTRTYGTEDQINSKSTDRTIDQASFESIGRNNVIPLARLHPKTLVMRVKKWRKKKKIKGEKKNPGRILFRNRSYKKLRRMKTLMSEESLRDMDASIMAFDMNEGSDSSLLLLSQSSTLKKKRIIAASRKSIRRWVKKRHIRKNLKRARGRKEK